MTFHSTSSRRLSQRALADGRGGRCRCDGAAIPTPTAAKLIVVDMPARRRRSQVRTAAIGARAFDTRLSTRMQVLNEMVGGLFSSRINMNLREEHGYTSAPSPGFVYRKQPGPFFIGTGIRTDVTGPAVGEIMKELKKLVEKGITQPELELGRDSIVRSLPADFETRAAAAGALSKNTSTTWARSPVCAAARRAADREHRIGAGRRA